jgi:glycosyltransferase involved in cell wall biosynthesis
MLNESPIKILFSCPNPALQGGPATHLPVLAQELRKYVRLETFTYYRKTDTETLRHKIIGRSKDLVDLHNKIHTFRPDIIHHNTAFDKTAFLRDAPLVWLAAYHKVPTLLKMHGSFDASFGNLGAPVNQLRNSILKHTSCIGVLSALEKQHFLARWPSLEERVTVVKNIIKPEFFAVERRETTSPTLLFISRFIRQKGMFDLLDAIPGVCKHFPQAQFIFVGSGSEAAEFDRIVKDRQLTPWVTHIAHVSHEATAVLYGSAWALVFPTHFPEGMPMVVAEAMAAGVPVITTRTKFSQSYMTEGRNCLYVEQQNPAALEKAILCLLDAPQLRQQMSVQNRVLARQFRTETVTAEFLALYQDLVAKASSGSPRENAD